MLFRIDTFSVPAEAREEFKTRATKTMALLEAQPGFVEGQWFEKVGGSGSVDIVTIVTWRDQPCVDAAGIAVRVAHEAAGFDPTVFAREHGIVESKALYVAKTLRASA